MASMNPRLRVPLITIGAFTIFVIAIFVVPRSLSLYYQTRGGQHIEYVLRFEEGLQELVCELLSPTNEEARKEIENGIDDLTRAIRLNKNNAQAYYYLGKANCLLGVPADAKENYLQYSKLRPENPLGYISLGFVYEELDDPSSAKEAWVLAGLTSNDFVQNSIENYKAKKIPEALTWLFRASEMGEEVGSSLNYFRHLQAIQTNDQARAQSMLELAIDENNGWLNHEVEFFAWYSWGRLLFEQDRIKNAEDALNYSINISPKDGVPSYDLSEAYRFLGLSQWAQQKYIIASKNLERSIEVNNNNPWAHIHYGKLLWILDQNLIVEIEDEFNFALQIAPLNPTVWKSVIHFWKTNNYLEKAVILCQQANNQGMISTELPSCAGLGNE